MKRVLFVIYAWPPAGGPGVQRCLKFAKYLPEFGWEPWILTVKNPETSAVDESLLAEIPEGLRVEKTATLEPFSVYRRITGKARGERIPTGQLKQANKSARERLASWIRTNLFVPDAKVGWWPFAAAAGKRIARHSGTDLIFSSGPPHTTHLAARSIAKATGLPWVADFRDPWTDIDYYHFAGRGRIATWLDQRMESACLRSASATTTISQGLVDLLEGKTGAPASTLLPNGYDPGDLPERSARDETGPVSIYYGGSLSVDRIPHALLEAMAGMPVSEAPAARLVLAGSACPEFETLVDEKNLRAAFSNLGYLSHQRASAELVAADIALLVINRVPGNGRIVTGKVFEYMGAGNPVLGIGPPDGDAARLLKETGSGCMFDYEDVAGIRGFLEAARADPVSFRKQFSFNCEQYSRRHTASQLAALFDAKVEQ